MSKTAHILCVSAGHGEGRIAPALGYTPLVGDLKRAIDGNLWFGPRPVLETLRPDSERTGPQAGMLPAFLAEILPAGLNAAADGLLDAMGMATGPETQAYPTYLQIIPYYLFRNKGRYLRYLRETTGGEGRLHGKVSIGVGGHVDLADAACAADGSIDLIATLVGAGRREAVEEIGVDVDPARFRWIATIYAVDNDVDSVHLGVVAVCDLTDEQANSLDVSPELGRHAFMTLSDVAAEAEADAQKQLETWTRLVIESNPLA